MASGEVLWVLEPRGHAHPQTDDHAALDTVADQSIPPILFDCLDYDGGTNEFADWHEEVPSWYSGGGFTFRYKYATDGVDADTVQMQFSMLKVVDLTDLDSDLNMDLQTQVSISDTPPATQNGHNVSNTGNLAHADAGSPAVGDSVVIRSERNTAIAVNSDDLQLLKIIITET